MNVMHKDSQVNPLIPKGMLPILEFLNRNKDCQKIIKRYHHDISKMDSIVQNMRGVQITLSTPVDKYGEFMSDSFVEKLREVTQELMHSIRLEDEHLSATKKENVWKE